MAARHLPILTYHSHRISGDGHESNDQEALRADPRTLDRRGCRIVPVGTGSRYRRETNFPHATERHRTAAAFVANGGYVVATSSRRHVPRFVFGAHWTTPAGLEKILDDAA